MNWNVSEIERSKARVKVLNTNYNQDDFIMFVTHKFQHYTLQKVPNFEQKLREIPNSSAMGHVPKRVEKALCS